MDIYFTKDIKQILLQKMLDQIHLYIYHPLSEDKNEKANISKRQNRFGASIDLSYINQSGAENNSDDIEIQIPSIVYDEENKEDQIEYQSAAKFSIYMDHEKDAYNFGKMNQDRKLLSFYP